MLKHYTTVTLILPVILLR